MITKRKGLYLGLLLSLLGIGNAVQAGTVTLENKTPHKAIFYVHYGGFTGPFCKDDVKALASEKHKVFFVGGCRVRFVKARVFEDRAEVKTSWKADVLSGAGGKFTVTGPHKSGLRYRITRK